MTTELSIYQRMPDPLAAIKLLGNAIARSGFFGCENVEQGEVLATECLTRGKPPLMLHEEYHIIFGRLSKKSEAMLTDFNRLGGRHKILSRTPDLADIELTLNGESYRSTLSWADAQKEPFVYSGKEKEIIPLLLAGKPPRLKDKYATPRARAQMLWARAVSDGVNAICPQAKRGLYTPEENADIADGESGEEGVIDAEFSVQSTSVQNGQANGQANSHADQSKTEAAKSHPAKERSDRCGDEAIKQIFDLAYAVVGKDGDAAAEFLKKHGVANVAELSSAQAGELLEKLKTVKQPSKSTISEAAKSAAESVRDTDPATETQVASVKAELKKLEQAKSGTVNRFSELLAASGRKRIADLTVAQCSDLISKLVAKNMEAFFTESLQPKN